MILLTGGSGRLGKELQKYLNCYAPSEEELDITKPIEENISTNLVIHCAAYTDVVGAEIDKEKCFKVNVQGTSNLVTKFRNEKFVFISSEYARNPQNYYSRTKAWAEEVVRTHPNYLIIRTSFVTRPFPHEAAFFDQYTQGDYVDVIAPMIVTEILKGAEGLHYVGTGRKTLFQLARQTVPDIKGIPVSDIKTVRLPHDYE